MKGKLLSLKEVMKLSEGSKIWVEDLLEIYKGKVNKVIKENNEVFLFPIDNYEKEGKWTIIPESSDIDRMKIYEWIEEPKVYYGDEILKMIREGKLKNGQKFNLYCNNVKQIGVIIELNNKNILAYSDDKENPIKSDDLLMFKFGLIEKEYMTFNEAVKTGKDFKYYTWGSYMSLTDIILELKDIDEDRLEEMFKEKLWEVEK